jgi:hypothetical protein
MTLHSRRQYSSLSLISQHQIWPDHENFVVKGCNYKLCLLSFSCWFFAWIIPRTWRWRWHVPPKRRLTFTNYTALYQRRLNSLRYSPWILGPHRSLCEESGGKKKTDHSKNRIFSPKQHISKIMCILKLSLIFEISPNHGTRPSGWETLIFYSNVVPFPWRNRKEG